LSNQWRTTILQKLLVNAVINRLTALLRVRNGELLDSEERMNLMRGLFDESFGILSDFGLTESDRLWDRVVQVCRSTRDNESSMLQDVNLRKATEIDFINGAIRDMAIGQGKAAPWNEIVTALVQAIHHSKGS
jgi:2-dehydropantoate 2-reductase